MKRKTIYFCTLAALMMLPACNNNDEVPAVPAEKETVMLSGTVSRADGLGIPTEHQAKLYVAERKAEDPQEELYCNRVEDITGVTYSLTNMLAQWYKLAFVSAPESVTLPDALSNHAFNELIVDYSPVLKNQDKHQNEDLAIYRANIDRWLMPDKPLTENVTMKRITGQLVLDMGVLEDQFPSKVSKIEVHLPGVPAQVYIRDNADGSVITTGEYDCKYAFTLSSQGEYAMYFNLLPCTLENGVISKKEETEPEPPVENEGTDSGGGTETETPDAGSKSRAESTYSATGSYIKVTYGGTEVLYAIKSTQEGQSIEIKPNVKTTVYFNGMENGEFEVRYAGFEGTEIDVEEDWNGWN